MSEEETASVSEEETLVGGVSVSANNGGGEVRGGSGGAEFDSLGDNSFCGETLLLGVVESESSRRIFGSFALGGDGRAENG